MIASGKLTRTPIYFEGGLRRGVNVLALMAVVVLMLFTLHVGVFAKIIFGVALTAFFVLAAWVMFLARRKENSLAQRRGSS
jgi:Sec-independent protein secretion pathway component TatC